MSTARLLMLLGWLGAGSASAFSGDPAPAADQFRLPNFRGAIREWHPWKAQDRLLIGTVEEGLWSWKADQPQPELLPSAIGRVHGFHEWDGDLWIGADNGVFFWKPGAPQPERLSSAGDGIYDFLDWGEDLVLRAGDGAYRLARGTRKLSRVGPQRNVWARTTVVWHDKLYFGNLDGLFSAGHDLSAPVLKHRANNGIGWIAVFDDRLFVGDRGDDKSLVFDSEASAPRPCAVAPSFVRSTLEWDNHLIIAADDGLWRIAPGCSDVLHIPLREIWGGVSVTPDGDLLVGANLGLFRWKKGAKVPEQVPNLEVGRVEAQANWKDGAVILADWKDSRGGSGDVLFWPSGSPDPVGIPLVTHADSLAIWRDGLALATGGLSFLGQEVFTRGSIRATPLPRYQPDQPIHVEWQLEDSTLAEVVGAIGQEVRVVGAAGQPVWSGKVVERNRIGGARFELTLPAVSSAGSYEVVIAATLPMGRTFETRTPLVIGGSFWDFAGSIGPLMGWRRPESGGELFRALAANFAALAALYFLGMLALFAAHPSALVRWHEALRASAFPGAGFLSRFAVGQFARSDRCLDAFVRRHLRRARELFENEPEVRGRAKWVPAPIRIGAELVHEFSRPPSLPASARYHPGLFELRRALTTSRLVISVEAPGGFGKSVLAFQIARWAASEDKVKRLDAFPMLPILVDNPSDSLDADLKAKLELLTGVRRISGSLFEALLTRRRVLAIVDAVSERSEDVRTLTIRPDRGAVLTQALIVTSRLATQLPDSLVIVPQGLSLLSVDSFLTELTNSKYGAGRFTGVQREAIRKRLAEIIAMMEAEAGQVPALLVALMLERANELAVDEKAVLEALPTSVVGLVEAYAERLLRGETDATDAIAKVRRAAAACLGAELLPGWRPRTAYLDSALTKEDLDTFCSAGLMISSGTVADPRYKFALDPVAEALTALEWALALRDGQETRASQRRRLPPAGRAERCQGFLDALERAFGEKLGKSVLDSLGPLSTVPVLSQPELNELCAAAVGLKLSVKALRAGLHPQLIATLPAAGSEKEQLLSDLHALNGEAAEDGQPLLRTWLLNATALSGLRTEGLVFDKVRAQHYPPTQP